MIARVSNRRGFALIEVLVAVVFIAVFMLALLQVRNQALLQFIRSGDQHTAAWLAEMKMSEIISQDLPDPEDDSTWSTSDYGDFAYMDDRVNGVNRGISEDWGDRTHFSKFEYEWTKELLFIGPNFIGDKEALDAWEQPLDENGEPVVGEDDPMKQPAARIVRITLTVYLPELPGAGNEGVSQERPSFKLVTYVDPAILFNGEADPAEGTTGETGGSNG